MADDNDTISLAVWDVPMPVVAGEPFSIKVGAKSSAGRALGGRRVEVSDAAGAVVASGNARRRAVARNRGAVLDRARRAGAGKQAGRATTPCGSFRTDADAVATRFSVDGHGEARAHADRHSHGADTAAALDGVEIRLGPFHARTDADRPRRAARLQRRVSASPLAQRRISRRRKPIQIDGDMQLELTMLHVPEEHPDARWVR